MTDFKYGNADGRLSGKIKAADLLQQNINILGVFSRMGIPLRLGDFTIEELCHKYKVDTATFLLVCNIYTSDDYVPSDQELSEVKMNEILSYLRLSHKYYLTSALSSLAATLDQLMEPCGETQRKVLQNFYLDYKREIEKHFEYEETNIFPLAEAIACGKKLSSNIFDQIEDDHSNIEEKIHDLKSIVMKYLPSECKEDIITVTLLMIYYLEKDLERHTAIEDTVLMPLMMRSNGE